MEEFLDEAYDRFVAKRREVQNSESVQKKKPNLMMPNFWRYGAPVLRI